jgi:protein-S-isoprenylcysteine O-methyltransferase Ste14
MTAAPDHARVIAPPPLIVAGAILLGMGLRLRWPMVLWPCGHAGVPATVCFAAALTLAGAAVGSIWRARTTVLPHRTTTALVTSGPFRFSRNPIYLAMGLLMAGVALAVNSLALLLMIPPWAVVMQYGVIAREERYLAGKFGEEYRAYCGCVRRWL